MRTRERMQFAHILAWFGSISTPHMQHGLRTHRLRHEQWVPMCACKCVEVKGTIHGRHGLPVVLHGDLVCGSSRPNPKTVLLRETL